MATRGRPLDARTIRHVQRLRQSLPVRKAAAAAGVAPNTVLKYARKPK